MCEEDVIIPSKRRKNGWEKPLHYQQIIGWSAVFLFLFLYFGILIHSLLWNGMIAAIVVFGVCLIVHAAAFIISTAVDPAPRNVRKIYDTPVIHFDRSKRKHVIQDYFCSLCEVQADVRTKHCRSCNKCIKNFDHHCKWLNNCVGSRNYKAFIICIASGLVGTLIVFITGMFEVISYFTRKTYLQPYLDHQIVIEEAKRKNETYNPNYLPVFIAVPDSAWLGVVIIIIILSLIPIFLLSQLLMLHAMFYFKHISSYEYVLQLRKKAELAQEKFGSSNDLEKQSNGGRFGINKLKHSITPEGFCRNGKTSPASYSKQNLQAVNV